MPGPPSDTARYQDVVVSCRVRLARNIAGFPFVNRASEPQLDELAQIGRQVLLGSDLAPEMRWVDVDESTEHERQLLVERHLISKQLADSDIRRGVAISGDESLAVMVNEEDHVRMQLIAPGLRLRELHERLDAVDDAIEARLDYAYSDQWGYLTACPTNVGTGIRFSVMMHLPALKITNQIDRVRRSARDLHLAVRGYYGEGSESAGDFYQVSNQVTLGRSEDDLLDEFRSRILPRMIVYEQEARQSLVERQPIALDDRIHRALGILRSARLLGLEEAMKLLSRVRLGVCLERLDPAEIGDLDSIFLGVQPAHVQAHAGTSLEPDERRSVRAEIVRKALG